MAQRQMRIGVVGANGGTDRWGAHLPAIAALEEAELVAVCTAREETAKRAQQRTGARLAFWNYEEMVRSPEIDLVTVAVRIGLHHPIVLAALDAGKHVFCEWPLALNAIQATELSTRAQARGVAHAVGTQARFSPGIIYAKELMESAYIGRPLFFHMTHFLASAIEPRPSHRWWSIRAEEGGGAILIACGHALDVVRWYLGEVAEVNGQVQTLVQETRFSDTGEVVPVDAIDTVACMVRLASGITGTVHVSNVCKRGSGFHLTSTGPRGVCPWSQRTWCSIPRPESTGPRAVRHCKNSQCRRACTRSPSSRPRARPGRWRSCCGSLSGRCTRGLPSIRTSATRATCTRSSKLSGALRPPAIGR